MFRAPPCGAVMSYLTVGRENSAPIRIYYEDHGHGAPVVLVHGYLLDGHSWEKQEAALLAAGHRVISYDRRGFGASSRPSVGYGYDTLAADLGTLLEQLDLRDTVLAGFCAGTGEVTRYLGTFSPGRVRAAALLAPLPPYLPRADDNPDGINPGILDEFISQLGSDRPAATKTYLDRSYNIDLLGGTRVSDQAWQNSFHVAIGASAAAALGSAAAWREDFHPDLARITIPVLPQSCVGAGGLGSPLPWVGRIGKRDLGAESPRTAGVRSVDVAASSGTLHVALLGGFNVRVGSRAVPGSWRLRKSKTLVKLLALADGHRAHRDVLAG